MSETTRFIDKMVFKVNIPQVMTIIGCTITIYAAFSSLRTDIQLISLKLEQHTESQVILAKNVTDIQAEQKAQDSKMSDIDKRVYRLEKN